MRQTPESFRGARTCSRYVLYHRAKFGGARISPAAGAVKNVECFVCLSVCLSVCLFVTLLDVRVCAPDFAMKALEYRDDFDTIGKGKVYGCATVFNFLRLLPIGDTTRCRSPKTATTGDFRRQRAIESTDRDEILHVSIYCGCAIAHQIWPSSVKGGRYRSPSPKCQNLPKIAVFGHRKPTQ